MAISQPVFGMFRALETCLIEDNNVKESLTDDIRELEQAARQVATLLQAIHQQNSSNESLPICKQSRHILETVKSIYKSISKKVPDGDYYKYLSHWQNVSTKLCFLASLIIYLEDEKLATREQVMSMLGVQVDRKKGFHIDLEDYLCGLLMLANELSRLAVNSVISGNYDRPMEISKFVNEMESGFRLLNLKNDYLRKKYDGLKYDVKKIEQVVYDLKIRGLAKIAEPKETGNEKY
uniref:translin-like n=1 Tax=Styela clava TaxID=7725 RepID=UPI00193AD04B|nr:translin-like [Styela clava]